MFKLTKKLLTIIIVLIVLFFYMPSFISSITIFSVNILASSGNYNLSETICKKSINITDNIYKFNNTNLYLTLESLYLKQNKIIAAQNILQTNILTMEKKYGKHSFEYVNALNNLIYFYKDYAFINNIEPLAQNIIISFNKNKKLNTLYLAYIYKDLAIVSCVQNDWDKAQKYFERAIKILETKSKKIQSKNIFIYANIASFKLILKQYDEAEKFINRAEELIKVNSKKPDYSQIAFLYNVKGELYAAKLKFKEAEKLLIYALDVTDKNSLLKTRENLYINLADLYLQKKEDQKAKIILNNEVNDIEKQSQKGLFNACILYNAANLYNRLGDKESYMELNKEIVYKLKKIHNQNFINENFDTYVKNFQTVCSYSRKGLN